ncbi:MAG: hypothetical protein L3K14_05930 [Thermoplasmata archaeon]|nr:hypothetical protein [Thermoplasmata archaeon]
MNIRERGNLPLSPFALGSRDEAVDESTAMGLRKQEVFFSRRTTPVERPTQMRLRFAASRNPGGVEYLASAQLRVRRKPISPAKVRSTA